MNPGDWIKIKNGAWTNHIGRIASIHNNYCQIYLKRWPGQTLAFLPMEFTQISELEAMIYLLEN